jgi:hypothetical protein
MLGVLRFVGFNPVEKCIEEDGHQVGVYGQLLLLRWLCHQPVVALECFVLVDGKLDLLAAKLDIPCLPGFAPERLWKLVGTRSESS